MKTLKQLSATLLMLSMIACTESSVDETISDSPSSEQTSMRTITVNAGSPSSRISIDPDSGNSTWTFLWESEESVMGWLDSDAKSEFTMTDITSDCTNATFEGTIEGGDTSTQMRLLYPYNETTTATDGAITFNLSKQTVDLSEDAHDSLGDNSLYMISDKFDIDGDAGTTMRHIFSYGEIRIQASNIDDENLIVNKAIIKDLGYNQVTVAYGYDNDYEYNGVDKYTGSDYASAVDAQLTNGVSGNIILTVSGASALVNYENVNETVIPFSFVPHSMATNSEFTVELYYTDGTMSTKTFTVSNGKDFYKSCFYTFTATVDVSSDIETPETPSLEFTTDGATDVSYYETDITVGVNSNVDWELAFREDDGEGSYSETTADWLSTTLSGMQNGDQDVTVTVAVNETGAARDGWILLLDDEENVCDTFKVSQLVHAGNTTSQTNLLTFLGWLNDGVDAADVVTLDGWDVNSPLPLSEWEGVIVFDDNADAVKELHLSGKGFKAAFPNNQNMSTVVAGIEIIDLSYNELTGAFGNNSKFPAAKEIYVNNNQITTINFSALTESYGTLEKFCIQDNSITAFTSYTTYPFGNATELVYLDMSGNSGLATQTDFFSISNLTNLEHLDISGVGYKNANLADLTANTSLTYLDVSGNAFTGAAPVVSPSAQMTYYNISNNSFAGEFTSTAQENLMAAFVMSGETTETAPIVISPNASLTGTLSATFQEWLKNDSHTLYVYTDDTIGTYFTTDTAVTLANAAATVSFTDDTNSFLSSGIEFYDDEYTLSVTATADWKIAFRAVDGGTYSESSTLDWISATTTETISSSTSDVTITVTGNSDATTRTGWILLLDSNDNVQNSIQVTQDAFALSTTATNLMVLLNSALNNGQTDGDIRTPENWSSTSTKRVSEWEGVTLYEDGDNIGSVKELRLPGSDEGKKFKGSFPDETVEISAIATVQILDLSNNELTGTYANQTKLTALVELYINDNKLNGTFNFPALSASYGTLEKLYVQNNAITSFNNFTTANGGSLTNATKLTHLDMSSFTNGVTIKFESVSTMPDLVYLDISGNTFNNTQLQDLTANTKLAYIDISNNAFTGTAPLVYSGGATPILTYYNISNNLFATEFTSARQTALMTAIDTTVSECPVITSSCASMTGTLTADFITWLKSTLTCAYTDQQIYDNILSGTSMSAADGSSYDESEVTKE